VKSLKSGKKRLREEVKEELLYGWIKIYNWLKESAPNASRFTNTVLKQIKNEIRVILYLSP